MQLARLLREGGGTREFHVDSTVTHMVVDNPDIAAANLVRCHVHQQRAS